MHHLKKYPNGLHLITVPIKGIKTVTVMVLFGVGAKYEEKKINGISHFLEHMMFKGTAKRPDSQKVSEDIDKVGGEYNAFTAKEYTGYYAKVGKDHIGLALEWLSDLIINSTFKEDHIEKERRVITEEMNMYLDTPTQHIHDVIENLLYGNQPAGWDVIGTRQSVQAITREDLVAYKNRSYTLGNCVICISGCFEKDVEEKVQSFFAALPAADQPTKQETREGQEKPQVKLVYKKTDQSHCIMAVRAFSLFKKDRYPLSLITTILGGGMSSRLFIEVREKRGLAYYVGSDAELYTDSGYLAVQAGLDNTKLDEALKVIAEQFHKLAHEKVSDEELNKAKEYIKGQSLIGMESSNSQAFYYGSQQILKGKIETIEQKFAKLDKITADDILALSQKLFVPGRLNLAVIGPVKDQDGLEQILAG